MVPINFLVFFALIGSIIRVGIGGAFGARTEALLGALKRTRRAEKFTERLGVRGEGEALCSHSVHVEREREIYTELHT